MQKFHFNIRVLLRITFAASAAFALVAGSVAYMQVDQINEQIVLLHNHPLVVRDAVGELRADLLGISRVLHRSLDAEDAMPPHELEANLTALHEDALSRINVFFERYLGPPSDVDSLQYSMHNLIETNHRTLHLYRTGNRDAIRARLGRLGVEDVALLAVQNDLRNIHDFAKRKAMDLAKNSQALKSNLQLQFGIIVLFFLALTGTLGVFLLRSIENPIRAIIAATHAFEAGDFSARSGYASGNEFGVLSSRFDAMADSIQRGMRIREHIAKLAQAVPDPSDPAAYFELQLATLTTAAKAHAGAIYLRSEKGDVFEFQAAIGFDDSTRAAVPCDTRIGEIGAALATGQMQHIVIAQDTRRLVLRTVPADIELRELICLPVHAGPQITALVLLGTVNVFSDEALELLRQAGDILAARIESARASLRLTRLSHLLHEQNLELDAQQRELAAQAGELQQQNAELEAQRLHLHEAGRLKSNFIATMSHELRTPLNSVIGLSGVLGRKLADTIPAEELSYLEVIERNGRHLLALINDILDIARIESGREDVETELVDVDAIASDIAALLQTQAEMKGIALNFHAAGSDAHTHSDARKLRHILYNIAANAVKFTETGHVDLNVRTDAATISVTIEDTGIGIRDEDLPHIFTEFHQAETGTARRYGGSGLGLAIARHNALLLGVDIAVSSTFGAGSSFTITIPRIRRIDSQDPASMEQDGEIYEGSTKNHGTDTMLPDSEVGHGAVTNRPTLLLVDDTESVIVQLRDILDQSYTILVAHSCAEGLAILGRTIPDAVILDLVMPAADGFDMLVAMRADPRTVSLPVLILTSKHITREDHEVLSRNNVRQLIQKGDVRREELLRAVSELLPASQFQTTRRRRAARHAPPLILLVEDNPDNLFTLSALLRDRYTIVAASDGTDALASAAKHIPDVILLDLGLPGMSGYEVLAALHKNTELSDIPIIAVTASASVDDRFAVLSSGFDGYLPKPVNADELYKTLDEVFNV